MKLANKIKELTFEELRPYCERNFVRLGQGSSRTVYAISSRRVIKIARSTGRGRAQNRAEVRISIKHPSSVAAVLYYDASYDWVISERARVVKNRENKAGALELINTLGIGEVEIGWIGRALVAIDYGFTFNVANRFY